MKRIRLGLLDFGSRIPVEEGTQERINNVIREAAIADKLGFSRLWYTEHYANNPRSIWLSPELMLSVIAAYTKNIKVGIAGVLTLYKSPLQIASNFKLLNNMFEDRIDLGFAKGKILGEYASFSDINEIIDEVQRRNMILKRIAKTRDLLLNEAFYQSKGALVPPLNGRIPEMWNLVSSPNGYIDSLNLGLNCSRALYSHKINIEYGIEELNNYKQHFQVKFGKPPSVNIVVTGTCQKTDKKWKNIRNAAEMNNEKFNVNAQVFGTPNMVYDRICQLAESYNVDEVIFLENSKVYSERIASLKNLSKIFTLT